MIKMINKGDMWSLENSFDSLKKELMKVDPVSFAETYLTLDGKPMKLTGNGWKFIADIYRHIVTDAMSQTGKPVVIVKGRQVGATTMASVIELYLVASGLYGKNGTSPVRVMHAFPQLELMHSFSKDKLETMINSSIMYPDFEDKRQPGKEKPYINARKEGGRDASDSLQYKQFKQGNVLWCESVGIDGTRVRGRTFDVFFGDEVQDMVKGAIPVVTECLAMAKHGPIRQGVQVYFGTPKQKGSFFHEMWESSDQRRYYLGCYNCNNYFLLYTPESDAWEKEIWLYENIVKCPDCGEEQDKVEAIERGKWIVSPGKEDSSFVGFHFNQLIIPFFSKEVIMKQKPENNPTKTEVAWQNEVLGEFHSGESTPITFDVIYNMCRDPDRLVLKRLEGKTTYLGMDWGGKPDIDGAKKGQSYSCGVVLSVEHDGRFNIEFAEKLKKLDIDSKKAFIDNRFRAYGIKSAVGDIGFAEDISLELKKIYGDKYKTARNSGMVAGGVKYNKDELEIVVDKDKIIGEVFDLLRKGHIRFPWGSYERVAWLINHCCSMESKIKMRNGQPHQSYIKGSGPNDGLMALIYAYLAYKFDKTHGFKVNPDINKSMRARPILAYAPKIR